MTVVTPTSGVTPTAGSRRRRILISTGEVSGDLQGGLLVQALHRQAQVRGIDLEIVALGGDRMAAAGATLLGHTTAIGSVGLVESIPYVLPTLRLQRQARRYMRDHKPDLVVMIDYAGPNLGIGTMIRRHFPHLPTVYYIAPQEWVWSLSARNTARIVAISDEILAIFPEEARYYAAKGAKVTWIGHPLLDRLHSPPSRAQARATLQIAPAQTVVTLIPASRSQELYHLLPVIAAAAQQIQTQLPQAEFWVPLSRPTFREPIQAALAARGITAQIVPPEQSLLAIAAADVAITKSGTVNLEIALLNVPQVVLYRVHPITAWVARRLGFSVPYMSPTNLVTMTPIVPEFMQDQATPTAIATATLALLQDPTQQQIMRDRYTAMRQQLGEVGVCDRAANHLLDTLMR